MDYTLEMINLRENLRNIDSSVLPSIIEEKFNELKSLMDEWFGVHFEDEKRKLDRIEYLRVKWFFLRATYFFLKDNDDSTSDVCATPIIPRKNSKLKRDYNYSIPEFITLRHIKGEVDKFRVGLPVVGLTHLGDDSYYIQGKPTKMIHFCSKCDYYKTETDEDWKSGEKFVLHKCCKNAFNNLSLCANPCATSIVSMKKEKEFVSLNKKRIIDNRRILVYNYVSSRVDDYLSHCSLDMFNTLLKMAEVNDHTKGSCYSIFISTLQTEFVAMFNDALPKFVKLFKNVKI